MTTSNDLAPIPSKENALTVFSAAKGLDPYLAQIRAEIDGFIPDISTVKGRAAIASIAHKVARSKTALDNVGKDLVAELKDIPKKIDAERKRMRDTLDAWKDEVRKPLDDWEDAEAARVAKLQAGIDWFKLRTTENADLDAEELKATLAKVESIVVGEKWEEFEAEAHRAKAAAIESLTTQLAKREKYDAEQAERDSTAKAEASAQAERQRQADEKAEQDRQTAIRESDTAHKGAVMRAAKEAFIGMNISEELAKAIVLKIARGEVPNVTINF